MAENTHLLPTDISALAAFPRLLNFMQTSLEGEVDDKYKKILGIKPIPIFDHQARYDGRVMLWNYINRNDWAVGIGYSLCLSGKEFPKLEAFIEIVPTVLNLGYYQNV